MEPQPGNRTLLITLLAVVLSAAITGGLVYAVQNKQNTDAKNDLQAQVDSLKSQLATVQSSVATPAPTVSASPAPVTTSSPTPTASTNRTLSNTKYGYSFQYPASALTSGTVGQTGQTSDVATADNVSVRASGSTSSDNSIFNVSLYNFEVTASSLQEHLGGTGTTIVPFTVAGKSGFKYTTTGGTTTNYYVTNTAGSALVLTVKDGNTDAQNMLSSFTFTR